jgi:hypothetical protein
MGPHDPPDMLVAVENVKVIPGGQNSSGEIPRTGPTRDQHLQHLNPRRVRGPDDIAILHIGLERIERLIWRRVGVRTSMTLNSNQAAAVRTATASHLTEDYAMNCSFDDGDFPDCETKQSTRKN